MGKQNDIMQGRNEGMAFALRIVQERGIAGLEKEVHSRNITGINARITHEEINTAIEKAKMMVLDTVLAMSCMVLRDEFGFGHDRLNRFKERFNKKTECLLDDYASWEDILETIKDETGVQLQIRRND